MKYLMSFFCLMFSAFAYSQALTSYDGGMDHYEKIKKKVCDTADIVCYYKLKYLRDTTNVNTAIEGQTVAMISDKGKIFTDYYRLLLDSINDYCAISRKNAKAAAASFGEAAKNMCAGFDIVLYMDFEKSEVTVQRHVLRKYQYTEQIPDISWTFENRDTIINNVSCKAAHCNFGGRHWAAWYAESIELPYGPYLFDGLPGLIMQLHDDSNTWIFTNNGVENAAALREMYLYADKDIIKKDKHEVLSACQNETEDWENLAVDIIGLRIVKNGKEVKPEPTTKKSPCNMIEFP